ncbi:MAG: hypothetical protein AAFY88_28385, partial [Acidobacteriota bacterium]
MDAPAIPTADLDRALAGLPVDRLDSVESLRNKLRLRDYDLLILPHGSAFPIAAWVELRAFLNRGGGLVVFGGAPFHQPVREVDGEFVLGVRQPTFADDLKLGPYDLWEPGAEATRAEAVAVSEWSGDAPEVGRVFALTVRLGNAPDSPLDHGSEAYRDAVLRPLVHRLDADGLPRACPLLEIDRLRGPGAGSRWVLAPTDGRLSPGLLRAMVERAFEGASQLTVRPIYASVESDETPVVRVMQRRPGGRPGEAAPGSAEVVVRRVDGDEVFRGVADLVGEPEARYGRLDVDLPGTWAPGLYEVEVETPDAPWHPRRATTGFWVRDEALLKSGEPVTASRDWLRVGGEVLPVVGATYMASDVHRKFLFEPDPALWDRDFAEMRRLGVNFV